MLIASDAALKHHFKDLAFYNSDAGLDYPIAISYSFDDPTKQLILTRFPEVDVASSYGDVKQWTLNINNFGAGVNYPEPIALECPQSSSKC